jgi:hypothetical protein
MLCTLWSKFQVKEKQLLLNKSNSPFLLPQLQRNRSLRIRPNQLPCV